mgnify:CR=1 FL=1
MANSRYKNVPYFRNSYPMYENVLEERGLKYVNQYGTSLLRQLTKEQEENIMIKEVVWEVGDRLDKLASREYSDPTYWWLIARYNNKPTDAHFTRGDTVRVPHPLSLILGYYTE